MKKYYENEVMQGMEQAKKDRTEYGRGWPESIVIQLFREYTPGKYFTAYDQGYIYEVLNWQEVDA